MIKKIFLLVMLCMITSTALAKDYIFKDEQFSITLPDSYHVVTKYSVDPFYTEQSNISNAEAVQKYLPYGPKYSTVLYSYNPKESLELSIKITNYTETAMRDSREKPELSNPEKLKAPFTEIFKDNHYGATLRNIFNYENKDALYIVCDADNIHPYKGYKYYIAEFNTIKNGRCYDIYVTYNSSNVYEVHKYLLKIIDSINYDIAN